MMNLELKRLSGVALFGSAMMLAACGGASGGASTPSQGGGAGPGTSSGGAGKSNLVEGPLDPVQDQVVTAIIGDQLGGTLPEPLGPVVQCAADTVNSLVDAPDALLNALAAAPNGADPAAALNAAADEFVGSLERFGAELQSTLMALTGGGGCITVAGGDGNGTALAGNPLAGTPLEGVGAALEPLLGQLGGISTGGGDDPNLSSVSNTVLPLLYQLSDALDSAPAEVRDAPVIGEVLRTLQVATFDLALTLPAVGNYDPVGTNAGLENMLNNLLGNVLTRVVPVEQIDAQTGQDFSGQIQAGIDTLTATFGEGSGQLITPLFNDVLNGAASPALDPVEELLAQVLGQVSVPGLSGSGNGNPLDGLLGGIAGNGTGTPLDALLALLTVGGAGTPLDGLTGALGGDPTAGLLDQLNGLLGGSGLPLDAVLGQLAGLSDPTGGAGLDPITGLLGGLLGGN